jgi:site-specific DNA-cytosine methylase
MKVLVACEESQAVCIAFREKGHEAYSCDILPCSGGHPEWHIQGDAIKEAYSGKYDLMVGHPPCTYLSYAATSSWNNPGRIKLRLEALEFFRLLWEAPIEKICLENPKSCASPVIAKYNQVIQPYYFGEASLKTTWLWLKNLPKLKYSFNKSLFYEMTATDKPEPISIDNTARQHKRYFTDGAFRDSKNRSKTFIVFAREMAEQWG